jgi:hypothetical protein
MVSLLLELGRNPSKPLRCKGSSAGYEGIVPGYLETAVVVDADGATIVALRATRRPTDRCIRENAVG